MNFSITDVVFHIFYTRFWFPCNQHGSLGIQNELPTCLFCNVKEQANGFSHRVQNCVAQTIINQMMKELDWMRAFTHFCCIQPFFVRVCGWGEGGGEEYRGAPYTILS